MTKKFIISLLLLFSSVYTLQPAFKDPGWGARPLGLAGAFTAISDDSNAVLFNPAGLTQIYLNQFDFMYGKPFAGLDAVDIDFYLITGAINIGNKLKLGFGYTNFITRDLYREDTALLSFAYAFGLTGVQESVGITFKWLYHSFIPDEYTKTDTVFSGATDKSAFSIDAGFMVKFFNRLRFGIFAKDINQPDVGLKDRDIVPSTLSAGLAYICPVRAGKLIPAFDVSIRDRDCNINLGIESFLLGENLVLRAGGNLTELACGATYKFNISSAVSGETSYAFVWPIYIQDTSGTHRISFGVRF